MRISNKYLVGLIFLATLLKLANFSNPVHGQTSATYPVTATIKISVCGNEVAESGEDCDNGDLAGKTCAGLGYASGDLKCDIACSFDTSGCSPAPTPTPNITSTPTESPTFIPTTTLALPTPKPALSSVLNVFDLDGSGKIELRELAPTIKLWVNEWKEALIEEIKASKVETTSVPTGKVKKCDLNRDRKCDLLDFSVLLYYIGR